MIAAFPMYAWAAKAEVAASRRGRFEAMRKDLKNPKGFAVLTEAQIKEAEQKAQNIVIDNRKNLRSVFQTVLRRLEKWQQTAESIKLIKNNLI